MAGEWKTNAGELAARNRRRAEDVRRGLQAAAKAQAAAMKADAVKLSSGMVSPKQRGQLRSRFTPRFSPSVPGGAAGFGMMTDGQVNVVTGVFRASWTAKVRQQGGQWTITLSNTSREGQFLLGGTRFMAARPLLARVQKDVGGQLKARAGRATKQAQK